jgi:alkanesulfonate monooxygenase SsuD/methylene tetrahydromethanopterin reductase-like flavin-dependent oxidoreductase (luciferase family)
MAFSRDPVAGKPPLACQNPVVRVGMTMPVMEPDLDAATLKAWARAIDDGPFSSLCWGERIAFDNPDAVTLLGALAAWTDRVRLVTTVVVPQLHHPVQLAKALATGDMLSGGRLTVGVGVGGRLEDYHAVGADPASQTMAGLAGRVAVMKRVWAKEKVTESIVPVGPSPAQPNGPKLLVGTMGLKTVRSAATWADGLAGTTLDLDLAKQNELFDVARTAWAQAAKPKPHLATSFWFALGGTDDARAQIHRHLRHYMNWLPAKYVDAMAPGTGWAGSENELLELLRKFAEIGTDEIDLIPTSADVDQLRRVADVIKNF